MSFEDEYGLNMSAENMFNYQPISGGSGNVHPPISPEMVRDPNLFLSKQPADGSQKLEQQQNLQVELLQKVVQSLTQQQSMLQKMVQNLTQQHQADQASLASFDRKLDKIESMLDTLGKRVEDVARRSSRAERPPAQPNMRYQGLPVQSQGQVGNSTYSQDFVLDIQKKIQDLNNSLNRYPSTFSHGQMYNNGLERF